MRLNQSRDYPVRSWIVRRRTLFFIVITGLLSPMFLTFDSLGSISSGLTSANPSSVKRILKQPRLAELPCMKNNSAGFKSEFVHGSTPLIPAPRIVRTSARRIQGGGGEFGCDAGDFTCSGSLCYHQCLMCVNGTWTSLGNCCIKCCNSAGDCVTEPCCTSR